MRLQFESDSSAAAVRLSPELSGLNKESSGSTVSEQPDTVVTHDKEIDYFEITLNNHHLILMNKQESVDFQEQDSHLSDSQKSDESSIQETKDTDLPTDESEKSQVSEESERPRVSEDDTSSSDKENITQDCNNASEMIDCCECKIKSEEEQKSSDCTVAAVRLSPVTALVKDPKPPVRPSIMKEKNDSL